MIINFHNVNYILPVKSLSDSMQSFMRCMQPFKLGGKTNCWCSNLILKIQNACLLSLLNFCRFAAALKDMKVWVMNVVPIDSPDTLPVIYERGLFGMYHNWCESFNTYPRSYDLLHADHLFSRIKKKLVICSFFFSNLFLVFFPLRV